MQNDLLVTARERLLSPLGMDLEDLGRVIGVLAGGAVDLADLYLEATRSESWSLEDGIVKEGLQRAIKVLEEHRDAVEKLTDELLAKDSLDGHVIREMLGLPPRENTEGLTIGPGDAPESAKATSSDAATKSDAAATAADASADAPGDEPATA